jgi:hypothetical protein
MAGALCDQVRDVAEARIELGVVLATDGIDVTSRAPMARQVPSTSRTNSSSGEGHGIGPVTSSGSIVKANGAPKRNEWMHDWCPMSRASDVTREGRRALKRLSNPFPEHLDARRNVSERSAGGELGLLQCRRNRNVQRVQGHARLAEVLVRRLGGCRVAGLNLPRPRRPRPAAAA